VALDENQEVAAGVIRYLELYMPSQALYGVFIPSFLTDKAAVRGHLSKMCEVRTCLRAADDNWSGLGYERVIVLVESRKAQETRSVIKALSASEHAGVSIDILDWRIVKSGIPESDWWGNRRFHVWSLDE